MPTLAQAAAAAAAVVENSATGFGQPVVVVDSAGVTADLVGLVSDIGLAVDPETGQGIAGRTVSATLVLASIDAAGLERPRGIGDGSRKPWLVTLTDITGQVHATKVKSAQHDLTVGLTVLTLEIYKP